ncbi:hypothetical protein WJX81_007777 [Elliptochloris bilobata]|uniref:RNA polymerase II assembly factor Rtp1 C-terminal domain-containing protein n=1 Tax=Elliptochloris bilobata TaxID=381761 RepID=A0AAW1QHD0_9CHLO
MRRPNAAELEGDLLRLQGQAKSGDAFPPAAHRRMSKFALGRRLQAQDAANGAWEAASGPAPGVPSEDAAAWDSEAAAMLAAMSPDEIEEACREVEDRLPPETRAFLFRRAAARQSQSRVSLAAMVRFGLDGAVRGLAAGAGAGPEDVVLRDPLRGEAEAGYTLREAGALARSSVPAQRTAACRLLGAVLARARPTPADALRSALGPPGCARVLEPPLGASCADWQPVAWAEVWQAALGDAKVVTALRVALDDAHAPVAAAAAGALAALVALRGPHGGALAASDACPLGGTPALPLRLLERPHALGAWVANATVPPPGGGADQAAAGNGDGAEGGDEERMAADDPMCGLLQMQVLERAAYLLSGGAAPAAVAPLLEIVLAAAVAGTDAAANIVACPGLLRAVFALVGSEAGTGEGPAEASAPQPPVVRERALEVLRRLCQAGPRPAQALHAAGLPSRVERIVVTCDATSAAHPEAAHYAKLQAEALRCWRALAQYGLPVVHLDDFFAPLSALLCPPDWGALLAGVGGGGSTAAGDAAQARLAASAEAHLLAAALIAQARGCPDAAMLTPGCAAALSASALDWLQLSCLRPLVALLAAANGGSGVLGAGAVGLAAAAAEALLALMRARAGAGVDVPSAALATSVVALLGPQAVAAAARPLALLRLTPAAASVLQARTPALALLVAALEALPSTAPAADRSAATGADSAMEALPVGSRLPAAQDWLLADISPVRVAARSSGPASGQPLTHAAAKGRPHKSGAGKLLHSIPEEEQPAAWSGGDGKALTGEASAVGCALAFALALEAAGSQYTATLSAEHKLRAAMELVLAPPASLADGREEPWHDPLARWALATLLERYCCADASPGAVGGPSTADAARWAAHFAADSFGDALLAAALAALLRSAVAPDVQAALLRALDDGMARSMVPDLALARLAPLLGRGVDSVDARSVRRVLQDCDAAHLERILRHHGKEGFFGSEIAAS